MIIQTDKELYRAEDLIRYRLFAFDADTRPTDVPQSAVISIIDPSGFTLTNITNPVFVKGRYGDELQLPGIVTIGLWTIRVLIEGQVGKTSFIIIQLLTTIFQIFEKTIDVGVYELPLFYANIEVAEYVAITDGR